MDYKKIMLYRRYSQILHGIKKQVFFLLLCFFLVTLLQTSNTETMAQTEESALLPAFGKGKIKIRLYTDYFCGPCNHLETQVEGILKTLIEKDIISITFIDVPFHKNSSMYVKYFLYALNEKKNLDHAFHIRTVLFNAAKEKIVDALNLESYLKKNNIKIKPFDEKAIYQTFEIYLNKEDKINATPSCVIVEGEKKEVFKGTNDVLNALKRLL